VIDVHQVTQNIIGSSQVGGMGYAIRATTAGLADCWDDCAAIVAPKGREIDNPNPYRLALEMTPDGPHEPRVEFVDEPDAKSEPELETRLRQFITTGDDEELAAMQIVVKVLDGLDKRTQNRIITYFSERVA
jgi:hypothetical protein